MDHSIRKTLGVVAALVLVAVMVSPSIARESPDLVVTALDNPPSDAFPQDSFVVAATVLNQGTAATEFSSFTRFILVPTAGATKNLSGVQIVPALAVNATASSTVTVGIFADTLPGVYRLRACADGGNSVSEGLTGEGNNCWTTTATITVHDPPDLVVTAISKPPASVPQGGVFTVTTSVKNNGTETAAPSTVKYYFCTPALATLGCLGAASGGTKIDLKNKQDVPALAGGGTFTNPHELKVRPETIPGQYRLQGCADSGKVVAEDNESNNCLTRPDIVQVTPQPDLIVKRVEIAGAPLTINAGEALSITAIVKNNGLQDSAASKIKFVFVDTSNPTGPKKNLKDRPFVPALALGTKYTVQTSVSTYEDTPAGVYTLQGCIDSEKVVGESDESNNCTDAPSTMKVTVAGLPLTNADLVVSLFNPPAATAFPGDPIELTATVKNQGSEASPATISKFNLVGTGGARKNLKGIQNVPGLNAGGSSAVPITLQIYADTLPGAYFLEACADGEKQVLEIDEDNNCLTSTAQVTVQDIPNLIVKFVDDPPADLLQGQSFEAFDKVKNIGAVTAPAFSVKYYLVSVADDSLTSLKGTQAVPSLPAEQTFSAAQEVSVRPDTLPGSYKLRACADSGKVVTEPNEEDNCKDSVGTVQVHALPDLIMKRVTVEGTPVTVALGASFTVTSVVKNQGLGDAGASNSKFYLVLTPGAAQKKALTGTQSVIALSAGDKTPNLTAVTVEEDTVPGTYYVLGCADEANKSVTESDENNNCATSAETVTVVQ